MDDAFKHILFTCCICFTVVTLADVINNSYDNTYEQAYTDNTVAQMDQFMRQQFYSSFANRNNSRNTFFFH